MMSAYLKDSWTTLEGTGMFAWEFGELIFFKIYFLLEKIFIMEM